MADPDQHVYLFRHGATEWSVAGKHTGVTDLPLIAAGRRNAERLRPALKDKALARVLCSPLLRATQTCRLAGFGDVMDIQPDLTEWHYGDYEGLTTAEVHRERPGWDIFTDGCPHGESPAQVGARADRVVKMIRATPGNVAVFAHGHVLRVLAVRWLGMPVVAGRGFVLDPATVSILGSYHEAPAVEMWNAPPDAVPAADHP